MKCQLLDTITIRNWYQEISRQIAKHEFVTQGPGKKDREKKFQNFKCAKSKLHVEST